MNNRKNNIVNKLVKLKHGSGSHSPSVKEIETIAGRKLIEIDAVFYLTLMPPNYYLIQICLKT